VDDVLLVLLFMLAALLLPNCFKGDSRCEWEWEFFAPEEELLAPWRRDF
jgi:hypothetical protein